MSRRPNAGNKSKKTTFKTLTRLYSGNSSTSSVSISNPRFRKQKKKTGKSLASDKSNSTSVNVSTAKKIMSVNNESTGTIKSKSTIDTAKSRDTGKVVKDKVLAGDKQVEMYLKAKNLRKRGELVDGPSVAMRYYNSQQQKGDNRGTNLLRKFLPRSRIQRGKKKNLPKGPPVEKADDHLFIIEALKAIVIFNSFSDATFNTLAKTMTIRKYEVDEVVCKQGEFSNEMFILRSGEMRVTSDETEVEEKKKSGTESLDDDFFISAGTAFGQLGMNYGSPRQKTIVATESSTVFVLMREDYHNIVQSEFLLKKQLMNEAVHKVKVLDSLPPEQLEVLLDSAELVSFPADTKIIEKGTLGGTFYMIASGIVNCIVYEEIDAKKEAELKTKQPLKSDIFRRGRKINEIDDTASVSTVKNRYKKKIYEFGVGEYFGERALLQNNSLRKADVVAKTQVELLAIAYKSFADVTDFVGLKQAFEENIKKQALVDTPFFDNLTKEEEDILEKALVMESFKEGEHIIDEGIENENFYIIIEGLVEVRKTFNSKDDFEIATLGVEKYFGEGSLLMDKKTNASVIAKNDVTCYVLSKEKFLRIVTGDRLVQLKETYNERSRKLVSKQREKKNEFLSNTKLKELKTLTTLGSGCFGLVKLVEVKYMSSFFALKIMEKGAVIRNNQQVNVMNEKKILLEVDHPFIVKLFRTFKDRTYLYFLLEFIQGGEMFQFLHHERNGYLDNETARFFVACVVDALDFLHKKRIVYRDLKPENLMIDLDGYAKVVDFGFAKRLLYKTFTLCGTAQYLAPEILSHRGYGRSVDFWTLGILIYELFTGTTPFKRRDRDEMFSAIKTENRIKFNKRWRGASEAKEMVCLLLHKHPKKRLGCSAGQRGFKEIKVHKWFDSIDFQKLFFKELPPPWIPEVKGDNDHTHFEEYDEEDNPLTGRYDDRAGKEELWKDF